MIVSIFGYADKKPKVLVFLTSQEIDQIRQGKMLYCSPEMLRPLDFHLTLYRDRQQILDVLKRKGLSAEENRAVGCNTPEKALDTAEKGRVVEFQIPAPAPVATVAIASLRTDKAALAFVRKNYPEQRTKYDTVPSPPEFLDHTDGEGA